MALIVKSLCVFCGSSPGAQPAYLQAASDLGTLLAQNNIQLVYGGGNLGLMGKVADSCMAAGGEVIGIIPKHLLDREHGHRHISRLEVVSSMHERKARMAELANGFVALPGGIGTLEELFEVLTWAQLGIHGKPVALINVANYFDPLLALLDHAVAEGFFASRHRRLLISADRPQEVLQFLGDLKSDPIPPSSLLEI
ncbi:MAG: TIGR00730 family Rossman fold protein [Burkholderiales bacterium]